MPKEQKDNEMRRLLSSVPALEVPAELQSRVLAAVHQQQQATAVWELWRRRAVQVSGIGAITSTWLFAHNLAGSGIEEFISTITLNPDVIPALGTDLLLGFFEIIPLGSLVALLGTLALRISLKAIEFTSQPLYAPVTT